MGSNPTYGDPPGDPDAKTLLARIASVDKEIAATQIQLREVALTVLGPQVEEALARVRGKMAKLALAPTKIAPLLAKFPVGSKVTVEMSPARLGIVLRAVTDPETGRDSRILLLEDGSTVLAATDEIREFVPGVPPPTQAAGPLSSVPEVTGSGQVTTAGPGGLRPGDLVETPLGRGRIQSVLPGIPGVYTVEMPNGQQIHVQTSDLRLVTP